MGHRGYSLLHHPQAMMCCLMVSPEGFNLPSHAVSALDLTLAAFVKVISTDDVAQRLFNNYMLCNIEKDLVHCGQFWSMGTQPSWLPKLAALHISRFVLPQSSPMGKSRRCALPIVFVEVAQIPCTAPRTSSAAIRLSSRMSTEMRGDNQV